MSVWPREETKELLIIFSASLNSVMFSEVIWHSTKSLEKYSYSNSQNDALFD